MESVYFPYGEFLFYFFIILLLEMRLNNKFFINFYTQALYL